MTDDSLNLNPNEFAESELDALKDQARLLGVTFHPTIGLATLQAKIDTHMAAVTEPVVQPVEPVVETANQLAVRLKREAMALVRIHLVCMNPKKREYPGELFTTGNLVVGTIKRYVPFNVDWHVETMLLTMLQDRMFPSFYNTVVNGRKTRTYKLMPEFNISILPPLTEAELHDLAQRQALAGGTAA